MAESTMSLYLGLDKGPLSEYLGKWWPGEAGVTESIMSLYLGLDKGPLSEYLGKWWPGEAGVAESTMSCIWGWTRALSLNTWRSGGLGRLGWQNPPCPVSGVGQGPSL